MTSLPTVRCLWWDHACVAPDPPHSPRFQASSYLSIEQLLFRVGKHLVLDLYTLGPTFNATSSTLVVIIKKARRIKDLEPVFKLTVNPDFIRDCTTREEEQLIEAGLVMREHLYSSQLHETPFPSLDHSPPNSLSDLLVAPSDIDAVGLRLLVVPNPSRADKPTSLPSWSGATVGKNIGFGATSTPDYIVAELGRQLDRGLVPRKIMSVVATNNEVTIILERSSVATSDDDEARSTVLFQLLQGGGVPWSEALRTRALSLGLLEKRSA